MIFGAALWRVAGFAGVGKNAGFRINKKGCAESF